MADKDTKIIEDVAATTRRAASAIGKGTDADTDQAGPAERATDQFRRIFGLAAEGDDVAARQAHDNLEAIAQCNRVLLDGMQAVWREWLGVAQDAVHRNVDGVDALMKCRSLPDLYAAQSALMKNDMTMLLDRGARISTLSAQVAADAMRSIEGRDKTTARRSRRA